PTSPPPQPPGSNQPQSAPAPAGSSSLPLRVTLSNINEKDAQALHAEMALLGEVLHFEQSANSLSVWLNTTASADDLEAVCCFIVNEDQVKVSAEAIPAGDGTGDVVEQSASASDLATPDTTADARLGVSADSASESAGDNRTAAAEMAPATTAPVTPGTNAAPTGAPSAASSQTSPASANAPTTPAATGAARKPASASTKPKETGTIRVGVEKVDQIINLVGELVITQA